MRQTNLGIGGTVSTRLAAAIAATLLASAVAADPGPASRPVEQTYTLPPVIVTAEKREEDVQNVPESVTVITGEVIRDARILDLRDASFRAPNVIFSTFAPPRQSFPFIRGIGSGQNQPAVTTYYDGVPQLSSSTANQELYNIDRIEFLRGPQGTLYGRNTLGGVINVVSKRPTNDLHADVDFSFGNYGLQDYRGSVSGAIVKDKVYFTLTGGFARRDGYNINLFDNQDVDNRNHLFGRFELLWTPTDRLDIRLMVNGERDRDGGFPIYDLASIRANPRRINHDFTGEADRSINQDAITATYHGDSIEMTSVSAYQQWHSHEVTDLDETRFDFLRRQNNASEHNLIQELRFSNLADKPLVLTKDAKLKWLAGVFAFRQDQDSYIGNETRPQFAAQLGSPVGFTSFTNANILNYGIGVFGDATLTLWDKLDLTAGLRYDYEHTTGDLASFNSPPVFPGGEQRGGRQFGQFSPRFEVGYHWTKDLLTYANVAKGYKVGGFNFTSPTNKFAFGPERSWTYEIGAKSSFLDDRLTVNADLFYIDWKNQQLDVPTGQPSVFFTDNVGRSTSKGAELEASYRVLAGDRQTVDVFGGIGYTNAQFDHYRQTSGVSADGHRLPFAPEITFNAGAQYGLKLRGDLRTWARADVLGVGHYFYDPSNAASQDTYILTNFHVGVGGEHWRLEGFINNAFNTHYVPIAFPFQLAASGYVGESGSPQTLGVNLGFSY